MSRGASGITLCGTSNVADGAWHQTAVTRSFSTGILAIFVDGIREKTDSGPSGNISYRNNQSTNNPNSDPFLVIAAEKHDAGSAYPSYNGALDEVRISKTIRYSGNFTKPTQRFISDTNTLLLYHFDDPDSSTTLTDSATNAGNPVHGQIKRGGSSGGPKSVAGVPFGNTQSDPTPTVIPNPASTPVD